MGKPIDLSMTEKAIVHKVSLDGADNITLLLDIQSMCSKAIVLNTAVIKDSEQVTAATIVSFQRELPAEANTTISIDLSGTQLSPGNYTVNLWTTKSHVLTSPIFSLPAK